MKLNRQHKAILELLRDHEWHANGELNKIAHRFGGRLDELREMDYNIQTRYGGRRGLYQYRWTYGHSEPVKLGLREYVDRLQREKATEEGQLVLFSD